MKKKIKYILFLVIFILSVICCATSEEVNQTNIEVINMYADLIEIDIEGKEFEYIQYDIINRRILNTGFYIILNMDGEILAHPNIKLVGNNILDIDTNMANIFLNYCKNGYLGKDAFNIYKNIIGNEMILFLRKVNGENRIILIINPVKRKFGMLELI